MLLLRDEGRKFFRHRESSCFKITPARTIVLFSQFSEFPLRNDLSVPVVSESFNLHLWLPQTSSAGITTE